LVGFFGGFRARDTVVSRFKWRNRFFFFLRFGLRKRRDLLGFLYLRSRNRFFLRCSWRGL
ncbi:MAG: hypothetical protein B1H12_04400, partial [Desulfobacteraceae bacterium 4484_190.2]